MASKSTFSDLGIDMKLQSIATDTGLGMFAANEMGRGMEPFIPMEQGALSSLWVPHPFMVSYLAVYARYQFEGDTHGFNYSKEQHPKATGHWDKAYIAEKRRQLESSLQGYVDRMG